MKQIPELASLLSELDPEKVLRITVSNKRIAAECGSTYNKVSVRKVSLSGGDALQFESFTDKQCFHENVPFSELRDRLYTLLTTSFRQLDGELVSGTGTETISLKLSKKEKLLVSRKKSASPVPKILSFSHNRTKNYLIPEGTYVPALCDLGVITADGTVVSRMYDKWKQINRFTELINDAVKNDRRELFNIIDFGCGKSYLTFVLYHYFTVILGKRVNIVGLDLKEDVIDFCNKAAEKYGYENLHFFCGDIKDYNADFKPDMVISLHACDTATDYALYNSVKWGADYIFSVPCCQHEVNLSLSAHKLSPLCDYGIIKERLSALVTDTVRAKLLEYCGYRTEIVEFIDIAHSPKNLLLRAGRKGISDAEKQKIKSELSEMFSELEFDQTLYRLIMDKNNDAEQDGNN